MDPWQVIFLPSYRLVNSLLTFKYDFELYWQYNGQQEKNKKTNNHLQKVTKKTENSVVGTPQKTGLKSGAPEDCVVPVPPLQPVELLRKVWRYHSGTGNQKRDNTMAKRTNTCTKGSSIFYKATRASLNTGGELRCSGMVGSSCSTYDTGRVTLVKILATSHEWRKDRIVT